MGYSLNNSVKEKFLGEENLETLRKQFQASTPFPHLVIDGFFDDEFLIELIEALQDEKFERREADLFQFLQTKDLAEASSESLRMFHAFLKSDAFIEWMESASGLPLKRNTVDVTANLYSDTDYLLCHDDQIPGRKIAFIVYLSDLDEGEGGTLNLFDQVMGRPDKIVKKIRPQFNRFVFFEVTPHSFHEVEEVVGETYRATITGWFHGAD